MRPTPFHIRTVYMADDGGPMMKCDSFEFMYDPYIMQPLAVCKGNGVWVDMYCSDWFTLLIVSTTYRGRNKLFYAPTHMRLHLNEHEIAPASISRNVKVLFLIIPRQIF